jgi:glycosyltransferase involved in cell wall biosynthesis
MFCNSSEINKISIVAPWGEDFISELIVKNKKISVHYLQVLMRPINFSNILRVFHNFLNLIKTYKEDDIILLFSLPSSDLFFKIPIGGLYFIFLLIKFNSLPRKLVQVVHDFIPYVYPDDAEGSERTIKVLTVYKKYFLGIPGKYIAVSQATKMDAEKFWHIPTDKIDVVYHGSFINSKTPRSRFGNNKVLIVSDIAPRKNHIRLIEALKFTKQIQMRS